MLGALVYTIIEAPEHGWGATRSLLGFGLALAAALAFVWWERRQRDPLIDVSLFTNLRFSAASGAVTVAFFALFGFIFLITQFFQLLQGFGPLETGVRILPVALSIAVGSVLGTRLAVTRIGHEGGGVRRPADAHGGVRVGGGDRRRRALPAGGGADGAARRRARADDGAGHRLDHGGGPARTGGRGFGGQRRDPSGRRHTGVAVVGSIFSTLYIRHLSDSEILRAAPDPAQATAREGLAQGLQVAAQSPPSVSAAVRDTVSDAFMSGLHAGCLTAAAVCLVGAFFVLAVPACASREGGASMRNAHRYGPWALITGASDGIGQAWPSTSPPRESTSSSSPAASDKLQALAGELSAAHGVETMVLPTDLSDPDSADPSRHLTSDLDIGLVVLAAGFGTTGTILETALTRRTGTDRGEHRRGHASVAHLRRQARGPRHGRNRAVRIHRRLAGCRPARPTTPRPRPTCRAWPRDSTTNWSRAGSTCSPSRPAPSTRGSAHGRA